MHNQVGVANYDLNSANRRALAVPEPRPSCACYAGGSSRRRVVCRRRSGKAVHPHDTVKFTVLDSESETRLADVCRVPRNAADQSSGKVSPSGPSQEGSVDQSAIDRISIGRRRPPNAGLRQRRIRWRTARRLAHPARVASPEDQPQFISRRIPHCGAVDNSLWCAQERNLLPAALLQSLVAPMRARETACS